ncbi:MAG: glycosyltransferase family 2 protein [Bacteroidota bacterium]
MISAIVTTYNEEDNIGACLDSLSWASERIVVDSYSTDNTIAIAQSKGARILKRKYDNPASQKNWAIPQAEFEWIILLDADERCPSELAEEILQEIKNPKHKAYWIKRKNFFMGKHVRYSGWQGDKVVRLFQRDNCRYNDNWVHEEIITNGKEGFLKQKLVHNTYKSTEHYLAKMDRYADYAVHDLIKKNIRPGFYNFRLKPIARFFKHFIMQLGFLDGRVGYEISRISAKYVWLKYDKLQKHIENQSLALKKKEEKKA